MKTNEELVQSLIEAAKKFGRSEYILGKPDKGLNTELELAKQDVLAKMRPPEPNQEGTRAMCALLAPQYHFESHLITPPPQDGPPWPPLEGPPFDALS